MQNLNISKVLLLLFFIIFTTKQVHAGNILPLPKPSVEKEIKEKVAKKKNIYPKKKPTKKDKKIEITTSQDTTIESKEMV